MNTTDRINRLQVVSEELGLARAMCRELEKEQAQLRKELGMDPMGEAASPESNIIGRKRPERHFPMSRSWRPALVRYLLSNTGRTAYTIPELADASQCTPEAMRVRARTAVRMGIGSLNGNGTFHPNFEGLRAYWEEVK